jgi:triacylglycerol lipase
MTPAPKFDLTWARLLAEFSARAYLPKLPDKMPGSRCNLFVRGPKTGATVLMEDIGDAIVLAFKGTKDIRDWLIDLDFVKKPIAKGINVHAGFLDAIDDLLPLIIERLNGNAKPCVITGHSLGGALATLAAFTLEKTKYAVRGVYTFASPRVGNAAFRKVYNPLLGNKTHRVVCAGDLVPLIPGIACPPCDG